MNEDIHAIAQIFSRRTITSVTSFGNGIINDTYLVATRTEAFILQRLNPNVFPAPLLILENQERLQQLAQGAKTTPQNIKIPALQRTNTGKSHHQDQHNHYWRAQEFIANSQPPPILRQEIAQSVGRLLGFFHTLCSPESALTFHNTLPGLHTTQNHLRRYEDIKDNSVNGIDQMAFNFCKRIINTYQADAIRIDRELHQPTLKKRLIHGDPKLDNILFHKTTGTAWSLIDLDTIGPGPVHHDLSDLIRSCCNLAGEDDHHSAISFDLKLAQQIITGYSQTTGTILSTAEIRLLGLSLWIIPFELGVRFFNDYLTGSTYFKTTHPQQNLNRARNQLKLADQILQQQQALQDHVHLCFT